MRIAAEQHRSIVWRAPTPGDLCSVADAAGAAREAPSAEPLCAPAIALPIHLPNHLSMPLLYLSVCLSLYLSIADKPLLCRRRGGRGARSAIDRVPVRASDTYTYLCTYLPTYLSTPLLYLSIYPSIYSRYAAREAASAEPLCALAFTRYCFISRLLYTSQHYDLQTAPLFGYPPHRPSSPILLRNILCLPDPPLLQYMPYDIGDGNIV